jgi:oligopeptide transport system substrate-binding protein
MGVTRSLEQGFRLPMTPVGSRTGYEPAYAVYHNLSQYERTAQAKALLADAGFGPDNPLSFSFRYNTQEVLRRLAVAAAAMWQHGLGVEVTLLNSDLNVLNADDKVTRCQWFGEHHDPSTFLYLVESGAIGDNHSKYNNPVFDTLMKKMYAECNIQERMGLIHDAECIIMDEAPIAPITYYVS